MALIYDKRIGYKNMATITVQVDDCCCSYEYLGECCVLKIDYKDANVDTHFRRLFDNKEEALALINDRPDIVNEWINHVINMALEKKGEDAS